MKTIDIIRRAGRSLRRAKMRTFLTSIAVAVGGFAIMASSMAGEGARQYVDRMLSSNIDPNGLMIARDKKVGNAQAVTSGASSQDLKEYNSSSVSYYGSDFETLNESDLKKLRARDDLKDVDPMYQLSPKYLEFSVTGDKKYVGDVTMRDSGIRMEVSAGKSLVKGYQLADDEAAIPDSYLETLGKTAKEVIGTELSITVEQAPTQVTQEEVMKAYMDGGEAAVSALTTPKTTTKKYKIVAVSKKTAEQMSSRSSVYVSPQAARELSEFASFGTELYQRYFAVYATASGKSPEDVKKSLESEGFSVTTAKDLQGMLFQFVNILQGIVMAFGILALVVSIFGIVNTMYISVLERTQQIGLMKSLGASKRDIARLFRYEAAWVGFLGGLTGVLAAWGVGTALNPWISEKIGLGDHSLLVFQPIPALIVVMVLMLVAIVAGFLPSRKAAKLDPIEALRTE